MEETLKSLRVTFRFLSVLCLVTASFLATSDYAEVTEDVLLEYRIFTDLAGGTHRYRYWVTERSDGPIGTTLRIQGTYQDLADRHSLAIIDGLNVQNNASFLVDEPRVFGDGQQSISTTFESLVKRLDVPAQILTLDLESVFPKVEEILTSSFPDCGVYIRLRTTRGDPERFGRYTTTFFPTWFARDPAKANATDCGDPNESGTRVAVHVIDVSNTATEAPTATLRNWFQQEHSIDQFEAILSKETLDLVGFLPFYRDYSVNFESVQKIIDARSSDGRDFSFSGVSLPTRFLILVFPLFYAVFAILAALQMRYLRLNHSIYPKEDLSYLRLFPSPIAKFDWPSRVVVLVLCVLMPTSIFAYLVLLHGPGAILIRFGQYMPILVYGLFACSALVFLIQYFELQSYLRKVASDLS